MTIYIPFSVEWRSRINRMVLDIEPHRVENWGSPLDTCYAILARAAFGIYDLRQEYKIPKKDHVTVCGEDGWYKGIAGGLPFKLRNLTMDPQHGKPAVADTTDVRYYSDGIALGSGGYTYRWQTT